MWQSILDWDRETILTLNGDGGSIADTIMWAFSSKFFWGPLYLLVFWFIYRRIGWRKFVIFAAAIGLFVLCADQFCNFFKFNLPKLRPTHTPEIADLIHTVNGYRGGLYGTVSSHAALSFGFAMFTSRMLRNTAYTWSIFIWAVAVAYSRIYLGVHYPLDLIFGTATGLLFGWIFFRLYSSEKIYELFFNKK